MFCVFIFSQQCFALQKFYLCRGPWKWHGWAQDTWHSVSSRSNLYHFLAGLRWEPEPVQTECRVPNFQLSTVLHTTEKNIPVYYQGPGKIFLSFQIILIFKILVLMVCLFGMPPANSFVIDAFRSAAWHVRTFCYLSVSVATPLASGETVVHDQKWDGTQGCGEVHQLYNDFKYLVIHS